MIASSKLILQTGLKHPGLFRTLNTSQKLTTKLLNRLNQNSVVSLSTNKFYNNDKKNNQNNSYKSIFVALVGALGITYYKLNETRSFCKEEEKFEPGKFIESLPTFTEEDLNKHNKDSDRIWVNFKNGIYDITDFIPNHPGGNVILSGAGNSIEPFWKIYAVHHSNETYELLEKYRIGNLKISENKPSDDDPFSGDPKRNPLLKVLSMKPFNAETPKELSVENLITPNEFHFKRNHLPVPKIDLSTYELEIIDDLNKKSFKFKLDDIKTKFQIHKIPVTIQCSGNRRKEMHEFESVQGLMWDVNAISTAEWTGVYLYDILADCGIDFNNEQIKHIQFEGLDKGPTGSYGASIPKDKVFERNGDVLISFQMNGVDIPLDHGFPLRVVVPGVVGARSVKWLNKIVLSNEESKSHWQQNDYKVLPNSLKNLKDADFSKYKAVQESPIQSAICKPVNNAVIEKEDEYIKIKGYAFSGGGKDIDSVIVSIDDGLTWQTADLNQFSRPLNRSWSWAIWELPIEIPKNKTSLDIICVASDSAHNTQPQDCKTIWNARGLMNNAWHKIHVELK